MLLCKAAVFAGYLKVRELRKHTLDAYHPYTVLNYPLVYTASSRDVQRQYVILVAAVEAVEAVNLKSP